MLLPLTLKGPPMPLFRSSAKTFAATLALALPALAHAQNQTVPGPGNARAAVIAQHSALVQSAFAFLLAQAALLEDSNLRTQTLDGIGNPQTCIHHRANLKPADKQAIVTKLLAAGLLNPADEATFPGGLMTGVFPPVLNDGTACPQLPQPFYASPGSVFGSHHSYPGGLAVHESNNETADLNLASEYKNVYGQTNQLGTAYVNVLGIAQPNPESRAETQFLDQDIIVGAPLWHDWAKPIVFQWNADGSEFQELSIGGNGALLDNYGLAGDARTGGHHILSIAESMKRGFSPAFVIAQASAHSAPTSGNEFKVVNWIRAAAIVAQIDPIATGYLILDSKGNYRLPALRESGQVSLLAAGQTNILAEDELHNLSDADFTFSGPAVAAVQLVLAQLAPSFGYSAADTANYNNKFRNVVLSAYSAERLYIVYSTLGVSGVQQQVQNLRAKGVF